MKPPVALFAILTANLVLWPAAWYLATKPVSTLPIKQQRSASDLATAPALGEVLDFSELSPVQAYSRPLFSKGRRPWQAPVVEQEQEVAAPAAPAAVFQPIEPPQVKLVGVSSAGGSDLKALMQFSVSPDPEWFIVGDDLEGWTISKINPQSVVIARGEQVMSFELYPEASAGQ